MQDCLIQEYFRQDVLHILDGAIMVDIQEVSTGGPRTTLLLLTT